MTAPSERRRSPRTPQQLALTIKVIYSSTRSLSPGHTFQAHTSDISETGVQVRLLSEVSTGAELEMWVISPLQRETLVLNGTVRWCRASDDDPTLYRAGIEIARRPTTDFRKWQSMAAGLGGI